MIIFILILICVAVAGIYFYNKLVRLKMNMKEAFSGIDIQLKRRHNLIPNIVETVKGYSRHESELLESVTRMRSELQGQTAPGRDIPKENDLSKSLKSIFALVEAYPDLKADKNFRQLQENLIEIEDQLQYARRYYNGTIRDYNILVQSFPSNLIANTFNFTKEEFFEIEYATERKTPDVQF
ncbi:MAG: LemA family protein [Candidatus Omnitrophica bacterium]|nr:LemA family protein [Candidatus Omnitrophota bacterium]